MLNIWDVFPFQQIHKNSPSWMFTLALILQSKSSAHPIYFGSNNVAHLKRVLISSQFQSVILIFELIGGFELVPGGLEGRSKFLIVLNKTQVFNGYFWEVPTAYIDSLILYSPYYSTEDSHTVYYTLVWLSITHLHTRIMALPTRYIYRDIPVSAITTNFAIIFVTSNKANKRYYLRNKWSYRKFQFPTRNLLFDLHNAAANWKLSFAELVDLWQPQHDERSWKQHEHLLKFTRTRRIYICINNTELQTLGFTKRLDSRSVP